MTKPSAGKTHTTEMQERNPQIEETMRGIAKVIQGVLPQGWGFALQLFTYGQGGSLFYISSSQREDMLRMMQEFIVKQGGEEVTHQGSHVVNVCRYCGLLADHWAKSPHCHGRPEDSI